MWDHHETLYRVFHVDMPRHVLFETPNWQAAHDWLDEVIGDNDDPKIRGRFAVCHPINPTDYPSE